MTNNFTNIWLDLRILIYSKYLHSYNVINENLTYYRQTDDNISSKFRKFQETGGKEEKKLMIIFSNL